MTFPFDPFLSPALLEGAERRSLERTARVADHIYSWRHRLNVTDWDVRYNPDVPPPSGYNAEITFNDSEKAAVITIDRDLPDKYLAQVVAHEMIHLPLHVYDEQASRLLVHVQDDRARTHLAEMLEEALEAVVDTFTRAMVPEAHRVTVTAERSEISELWSVFA